MLDITKKDDYEAFEDLRLYVERVRLVRFLYRRDVECCFALLFH
jgi:hypothetical protein